MNIQLSSHFTYKKLFRFVIPSILMMIFTSMYTIVDGFFISNFVGKIPFAAVNLIMPVIMGISTIGFMIGSLRKVWPWKVDGNIANSNIIPSDFNSEFVIAIILAILGLAFMLIMEYIVNKLSVKEETKTK